MKIKKRLDAFLGEVYPQYSRTQLQSFIMQGKVFIDGVKVTKPGVIVPQGAEVVCTAEQPKYVCRAGWKLEKALDHFGIDVAGLVVLDAGMSTGGFTDCMLQRDVKKVYGIDVGHTQAHEKIRQDDRVLVVERMNLKEYQHEGEPIDLITLDLSFISLLKVMDVVKNLLVPGGKLVTLIKPQFEADRSEVPAGGVIKDTALQQRLVDSVVEGIQQQGFELQGITESPILGAAGNREFLAYFIRNEGNEEE